MITYSGTVVTVQLEVPTSQETLRSNVSVAFSCLLQCIDVATNV